MLRSTSKLSAIALVLAAASVSGACSSGAEAPAQAPAGGGRGGRGGGEAVPVSTAHVLEKSVPLTVQTVGNIEAFTTVELRAQISGPVVAVLFAEGDEVRAGQPMFRIDARPFEVALQQAQAQLAKDQGQARTAHATLDRNTEMLNRGLLSKADYDTSAAAAAAIDGTVRVDQVQIDNAKLQLSYTEIAAPVAGRTGALMVHQGSMVRTADTLPLVVINQITPIRATFAVPGQYLGQVRSGHSASALQVQARAAGTDDAPSSGPVTFVDNSVDPGTGTIRLKATFPNADRRLWPGELVEVELRLSVDAHAIVVPTAAVQNGQQGQYVFVVQNDRTVVVRPVKVVRTRGDDAVVSDGLKTGEEVVTDGQLRLTPGAKITVKPPVVQKATS